MKASIKLVKMVDLTDLEREVIDCWENKGIEYRELDTVSTDPHLEQIGIKEKYEAILDDPLACVLELGYPSISQYIASKIVVKAGQEQVSKKVGLASGHLKGIKNVGVKVGYQHIGPLKIKYFFEDNGRELEFYIEHDNMSQVATIWIRPGVTDGSIRFIQKLLGELERAMQEGR